MCVRARACRISLYLTTCMYVRKKKVGERGRWVNKERERERKRERYGDVLKNKKK